MTPSSRAFSKCVDRNQEGIVAEKAGDLDAAIALYEANVAAHFEGSHPYDRLRIIYTKQKRWDDAIRVCRAYIQFGQAGDVTRPLKEKLRRFILEHDGTLDPNEEAVLAPAPKPQIDARPAPPVSREGQLTPQVRMTNQGIEISLGRRPRPRLTASPTADQVKPKHCYIYAHQSLDGVPFYIGKGQDGRAWSKDRDANWQRFVNTHLSGQYKVVILADNLTERQAEELESDWIAQEADTLVNWISPGRRTDFEANARYHQLRNANRLLIERAQTREKTDLVDAIEMYRRAIDAAAEYVFLEDEQGLVAELMREGREEAGYSGEVRALDRLTMGLLKLGQVDEAKAAADAYFDRYRADISSPTGARIRERLQKAKTG
jgi:hypothetical protein